MKFSFLSCFFLFLGAAVLAQQNPIRIEGYAQGTTYHMVYFDSLNRDLQTDIEKY